LRFGVISAYSKILHHLFRAMKSKNQEQKNVNAKGFIEEIQLSPAGYHRDRALNKIFCIEENVEKIDGRKGSISPSPTFIKLAEMFQDNVPSPAGGWYLVKEQRDWLKNSIIKIARKKYEKDGLKEINILEAGVASFNHHFSYLIILKEAILELDYPDIAFNVTVTDKAFYPLFCIDEINKTTFEAIVNQRFIKVFNNEVPINDAFIETMQTSKVLDFDRIRVRTKQYDLSDDQNTFQLGRFEIITEHFITSVIDNFQIVNQIRATYAKLLKEGGFLLDASGIAPHVHGDRFDEFLDFHEDHGLMDYPGRMNVWDPYGMRPTDILRLLKGETIEAYFDNGLYIFRKESKR